LNLLALTKRTTRDLVGLPHFADFLHYSYDRATSRLEYKPDLFRFCMTCETMAEVDSPAVPDYTWEECCLQRAQDLLALDKDEYVVAYSGGIDSTGALIAMLRTWPAAALKKIRIYLSSHSIEENVHFFDEHVIKFPLLTSMAEISARLLANNGLLVTGEMGDQLLGSSILFDAFRLFGPECMDKSYEDHATRVIAVGTGSDKSAKAIFERFHPIVEECPFPIRTLHDFFWWVNFTQKWQYIKYRFLEMPSWDLRARHGSEVTHFYDAPYFQKWSLHNHDKKTRKTWDSYKFTSKQFIYDFTRHAPDLELVKIESLPATYNLSYLRLAISEDLVPIERLEDLYAYARQ
jgi:hypothetical protein